jgi:hypothetical protein
MKPIRLRLTGRTHVLVQQVLHGGRNDGGACILGDIQACGDVDADCPSRPSHLPPDT